MYFCHFYSSKSENGRTECKLPIQIWLKNRLFRLTSNCDYQRYVNEVSKAFQKLGILPCHNDSDPHDAVGRKWPVKSTRSRVKLLIQTHMIVGLFRKNIYFLPSQRAIFKFRTVFFCRPSILSFGQLFRLENVNGFYIHWSSRDWTKNLLLECFQKLFL